MAFVEALIGYQAVDNARRFLRHHNVEAATRSIRNKNFLICLCILPEGIASFITMAFEVPLEADRVNDSNFFSTFVRAPLIGTILWILGGNKSEQEENADCEQRLDDDFDPSIAAKDNLSSSSMKRSSSKQRSTLKKTAPSLIGSDISDVGEVRESLDSMCLYIERSTKYKLGMPKKELSWSDENGRELVAYDKEVSRRLRVWLVHVVLRSFWVYRKSALVDTARKRSERAYVMRPAGSFLVIVADCYEIDVCCCCKGLLRRVDYLRHGPSKTTQKTFLPATLSSAASRCLDKSDRLARLCDNFG
jgi:hypothetical protein